jgi:hypothetical protein
MGTLYRQRSASLWRASGFPCSSLGSAISSGYELEDAQHSTRYGSIGYVQSLQGLLQVPRLQWKCEVRAIAHTKHGGIR